MNIQTILRTGTLKLLSSTWDTCTPWAHKVVLGGYVKLKNNILFRDKHLFNLLQVCMTWIKHQQLWGCKVEVKLRLGVHEQGTVEYHCTKKQTR
jgi:hypothetical protein